MRQLRGFKYRFYPTLAQRLELAQTFGCTRFVYNWALALRTNSYYQDNVSLSYTDTSNALTKLKKDPEKPWLKQVSAVPLQQGLRHLNTAFINFFAGRNKYPRFKKKNGRQSAHYAPNAFKWQDGKLALAKMSQPLKIRWSRHFTGQPKSVTISKDPSNRYFVSFLVEEELEQWSATDGKIGVDLGVKDVMVTSTGFASGNPKHYQKYQARLKTLQRRLAKKKKGSNNRYKAKLKVAKLHAKIADCRKDFLHKLTTQLVRENQAIYTETLAVKNMMSNHKLAKAIADCVWGEALRQFQYKCQWHDRTIGAIDRWFPSSKRCNPCGHILDKLPLDVREWTCPSCGSRNPRDKNAALNILAVGQTVFASGLGTGGETDILSLAILG
ncbi:transposase [Waterburya agarophytonicola K14]|uniref:Transposase n=1 Tax=Waterburya agarophytonicola KI4 TaxID=2874699 RepID=A0A964BNZ0_9CYAN|nr:transposase [Waterburya agarophytonicola]MCC0176604.1 transposase [Waterburya agarophytonicola KI4]